MLQTPGELGLQEEAASAVGLVGQLRSDLLEGDLAVQLGVECDADLAEAARGVRPQEGEARPARAGCPDGPGRRTVSVTVHLVGPRAGEEASERGTEVVPGDDLQP